MARLHHSMIGSLRGWWFKYGDKCHITSECDNRWNFNIYYCVATMNQILKALACFCSWKSLYKGRQKCARPQTAHKSKTSKTRSEDAGSHSDEETQFEYILIDHFLQNDIFCRNDLHYTHTTKIFSSLLQHTCIFLLLVAFYTLIP